MSEHRAEVDHGGVGDLPALISVGQLRVTLIALAAGASLADHENPGAATLHVLTGSAVLHTGSQ